MQGVPTEQKEKSLTYPKENERKFIPFSEEEDRKTAKEGEEFDGRGMVKTEWFEKTITFLMGVTESIFSYMNTNKSFRMELFYDAESLNTNYCFYTPIVQCEQEESSKEQAETNHRTMVEKEAEKLICQCKFEEANALLATLD